MGGAGPCIDHWFSEWKQLVGLESIENCMTILAYVATSVSSTNTSDLFEVCSQVAPLRGSEMPRSSDFCFCFMAETMRFVSYMCLSEMKCRQLSR